MKSTFITSALSLFIAAACSSGGDTIVTPDAHPVIRPDAMILPPPIDAPPVQPIDAPPVQPIDAPPVVAIDAPPVTIDAPPVVTIDAPPVTGACTAQPSYPDDVQMGQEITRQMAAGDPIDLAEYQAELDSPSTTTVDVIDIGLWPMYGAFSAGNPKAGTYMIDGTDDADPNNCGLCVEIWPTIDPSSGTIVDLYYMTGGTVKITKVPSFTAGTGTFAATITNGVFAHGSVPDPTTGMITADVDSCMSSIPSLTIASTTAMTMTEMRTENAPRLGHGVHPRTSRPRSKPQHRPQGPALESTSRAGPCSFPFPRLDLLKSTC